MTKETVVNEFLESKLLEDSGHCKSSSSNIHRISDDVFTFTEYNFLPSDDTCILDGHFTIFVNYKTFKYLLYKSADYGGLTYVIDCEFGGFLNETSLPESSRKTIESLIAHKLLGAYFYDGDHINHKGKNLIENNGECYYKRSLICDNRGYVWSDSKPEIYSEAEVKALEVLAGWKQPDVKEFSPEFINELASKFKRKKGVDQFVPLVINGVNYRIAHHINTRYGRSSGLLDENDKMIASETLDHKLKDFIRIIPTILKNIAI